MPVQGGNNGKAVQILQMNDDYGFSLIENQLEAILLDGRFKDKHVVVVSVAGAYRQGKSFLLACFLRFLLNEGQSNWLDDPSIPLGGFEWRPGSKRHTTGILLWNPPFLVTTPEGEEVVVLLMDTQGSFDCKSTVKECTTIFALSVLISSVQVYNIFRNIQMDHLHHLQFFSEYACLAQQVARGAPFQRLVFLVRDWAFPYEADFGAVGDRCFLQEHLHILEEQRDEVPNQISTTWASFSKIDCFLMPPPGDKVERDCSFDGCPRDIDWKFKQKLQELVLWLLGPENLVAKKINGQKVTCQELMTYFRAYARSLQGGTLPLPKSLLQVTVEASHAVAIEKAMKFYLENIAKVPLGDTDKFFKAHDELKERAMQLYRNSSKIGDGQDPLRYAEALRKDIQVHFERLFKLCLREKENEDQRKREREIERKREHDRQREREMHSVMEKECVSELKAKNDKVHENEKKKGEKQELLSNRKPKQFSKLEIMYCVASPVLVAFIIITFIYLKFATPHKVSNTTNASNV